MKHIIIKIFLLIEIIALSVLLYLFSYIPVELKAVPTGPLYEGDTVGASFFDVRERSFFGNWKQTDAEMEITKGASDYTVVFSKGNLEASTVVKFIPVTDIEAYYTGRLYAGDMVSPSNLSCVVSYADGTKMNADISGFLPERLYEPYQSSLDTPYGSVDLSIDVIRAVRINVTYDGEIYPGMPLDNSLLSADVVFEDGMFSEAPAPEFADKVYDVGRTDAPIVVTAYGEVLLDKPIHEIKKVTMSYSQKIREGETFDPVYITATVTFDDGTATQVYGAKDLFEEGFTIKETACKGVSPKLKTRYGTGMLDASIISVSEVKFKDLPELYSGDKIPEDTFVVFVYEDKSESERSIDDVDWTKGPYAPLDEGVNNFSLTWCGRPYFLEVDAKKATLVHKASQKYASEFLMADHTYLSDNTFVTITHYVSDTQEFDLAHIVINSPSQLRAGLSHDTYGGSREKATDAAARLNWVVGINASMFSYETGRPILHGAKLKWGQKMPDCNSAADGFEVALTSGGRFFQPAQGTNTDTLLHMGVTDTFIYGDPAFLQNGHKTSICETNKSRYPHTAVAMVSPSEYYFLTTSTGTYDGGSTYTELADFFMERGCEFGACLDGGGSSSLVFNNMLVNRPSGGGERAVVDFIYIVDTDVVVNGFEEIGTTIVGNDGIQIDDEIMIEDVEPET